MAAVIYFRGSDAPLTPEQAALFNMYRDQAAVWSTSILKAAVLASVEEWQQKRKELTETTEQLNALQSIQPIDQTAVDSLQKKVDDLTNEIKEYKGPKLTDQEQTEILKGYGPYVTSPEGTDFFDKGFDPSNKSSEAWRIFHKAVPKLRDPYGGPVADEEEFVNAQLLHALRTYDPAREVKFSTWLWNIMVQQARNWAKRWKIKTEHAHGPLEYLDEPIGEEGTGSLEEVIEGEGLDVSKAELESTKKEVKEYLYSYPEFLKEQAQKLYEAGNDADGKKILNWSMRIAASMPQWADRRYQMYEAFIDGASKSELAKRMGLDKKRISEILYGSRGGVAGRQEGRVTQLPFTEILKGILSPELSDALNKFLESGGEKEVETELESLLKTLSNLNNNSIDYNLLRNKIQQKLNSQLFTVYTHLYEEGHSNPETARRMKLSPPRVTGLKKKIIATLIKLPEIQDIFEQVDGSSSISSLRRFLYRVGDKVKVTSIDKVGTIENFREDFFKIALDNGNTVLTSKSDLQKHSTLIDSAQKLLSDYFSSPVLMKQCYLSLVSSETKDPALVIVELHPASETTVTARLYVNDDLVDLVSISEANTNNLISILKGHLGIDCVLNPPFTGVFHDTYVH